jgi:hypothetical protein
MVGTASGRPEAVADDEREGEVGPAQSSREASEQSGSAAAELVERDLARARRWSRYAGQLGVWSIAFIPIVLIVPPTELQWPANSGLGQYS